MLFDIGLLCNLKDTDRYRSQQTTVPHSYNQVHQGIHLKTKTIRSVMDFWQLQKREYCILNKALSCNIEHTANSGCTIFILNLHDCIFYQLMGFYYAPTYFDTQSKSLNILLGQTPHIIGHSLGTFWQGQCLLS